MATSEGAQLSKAVREKIEEFVKLCQGLDEQTASRAPAGRWSPKQIVSHLCGPDGIGFIASLRPFIEQDTPRIDIEPENPFFSEKRARMSFAELLTELQGEYGRIADFVAGLSEEQLNRKAHIPLLKETPIGEYPTLAAWVQAIVEYHVTFHVEHMGEILQALGSKPGVAGK
jgi:hypothetical protein